LCSLTEAELKKITKYIIKKSCTMLVVQKCFICFYDCFLDRSCLLSVSLGRISLTLNCTKKASKFATRNQKLSLKLSKDIGDAVHSSKIKGGSCQKHPTRPGTGKNVKHLKNRMLALSHSFPSRVLWREMKGISEKKVRKTTRKEPR